MTKQKLKQYRALLKEQEINDKAIDKLYDRAMDIPVVLGKVTGSSRDFPYTEVRTSVLMDEPKEEDEIERRMRIKKARREQIRESVLEIEEFIAAIPDSTDRMIFELIFLEGKKQREAANVVGYTQGRVSQIICNYIQD